MATRQRRAQPTAPGTTPAGIETVEGAAEQYLLELELSPRTRTTYRHGLNALLRFLREARQARPENPCPLAVLTESTLAELNGWLRRQYPDARTGEQGVSRTARAYLMHARRLTNWMDVCGLLPAGLTYDRMVRRIDAGRGHRRQSYVQRPTDPDVIRVVTHYLRQDLPRDRQALLALLRNRALTVVLYDTAMRISEALALTRADVLDGRAKKLRLTQTKNGKPRTVFLSARARVVVHAYCAERDDGPLAPLFASHGRGGGTGITPSYAWRIVKEAAIAEGLYANTSPHSLRHARAQALLDNGMPLEWVSALLGHEHVDTTRIVYAFETNEDRVGAMVSQYGRWPTTEEEGETKDG